MGKDYERAIRLDRVLLDQIGGRWMLLVLGSLCDHEGAARFNMIKRSVPGISQKTLTLCLRQLERSGLIARTVLNTAPIGVEYSFTKLGDTLEAPVAALYKWTREHSAAVREAQVRYDAQRRGTAEVDSRTILRHKRDTSSYKKST
jgi:DNA-binding HxlR family transcriptional regulator